jgi:predicted nucleic acid-binding protein
LLPSLWIYEVGNIVGRNIPEKAFDFLEMLIEYRIEESPVTAKIAERTLAIMDQCGVTFYDAVYHAVALERRGTLLTADASYLKKAGKLGSVLLLADLY